MPDSVHDLLTAESFLEYAFLRWVLHPATTADIISCITAQQPIEVDGHVYRTDYEITGAERTFAVELDGFEFHGNRRAFTYDRLRQNDLLATGRTVLRFSYDAIRLETRRCIEQLQAALKLDTLLSRYVVDAFIVETPAMDPDPLHALAPAPNKPMSDSYFETVRDKINHKTLRDCQTQAFAALANYFHRGGHNAACVMSVGAGKTALGVVATLAFAQRRALVITPGSVIRGTFDKAYDHEVPGNVLYGLPGGPLIPGCRPPKVLTLDRDEGAIRNVTRREMLDADVIITNFHSLGTGDQPDDLISKLEPGDIDFIVIDEAHIAASESYQRTFKRFSLAKTVLMSACFQRLDGKPIDSDVVYRYRLIDSIADGNAKNLRVTRFSPESQLTIYEMVWPDGAREEIRGRQALLDLIRDERKLATITAKSTEPIRRIMQAVRQALEVQAELLYPVKPRVLFSALGERHAEQIARIAEECGIPCDYLHHSMTEKQIRSVRQRFEQDSGDLQGIVQLKMLGQGYDFPPICVVVPMRPYGSFSEFYQFIGRGIRVIFHPALIGRVGPGEQFLDVICHAELGLDDHIETIYRENDMDPLTSHTIPATWRVAVEPVQELPGVSGRNSAERPEAFVLFERGAVEQRVIHDSDRVEQRRVEREREALAQRYSQYAQSTENPVSFEQFADIIRRLSG